MRPSAAGTGRARKLGSEPHPSRGKLARMTRRNWQRRPGEIGAQRFIHADRMTVGRIGGPAGLDNSSARRSAVAEISDRAPMA